MRNVQLTSAVRRASTVADVQTGAQNKHNARCQFPANPAGSSPTLYARAS
jgi:hypothetical protein